MENNRSVCRACTFISNRGAIISQKTKPAPSWHRSQFGEVVVNTQGPVVSVCCLLSDEPDIRSVTPCFMQTSPYRGRIIRRVRPMETNTIPYRARQSLAQVSSGRIRFWAWRRTHGPILASLIWMLIIYSCGTFSANKWHKHDSLNRLVAWVKILKLLFPQ